MGMFGLVLALLAVAVAQWWHGGSLLTLLRQSAPFVAAESHNGFYQDNAEGADLLRLRLPVDFQIYPQVSGHKTRFAIRFLHTDSEHGIIPATLPFEIACC